MKMEKINLISVIKRFSFPSVNIRFSNRTVDRITDDLTKADLLDQITPEAYLRGSFLFSFITSLFISIITLLLTHNIGYTLIIFLLGFALTYLFFIRYPSLLKRRRAEQIESDLPMALRALAIQLDIKMPFEQAIKHVGESNYYISPEFSRVYREIKSGVSVQQALTDLAERIDSQIVKRVVNQMILVYETGGSGEVLKRIANELSDIQFNKLKEYEAKMSFASLIYIATSALIPTFFQMFTVIGGFMLPINITPAHIWLFYLIVFPIINLIVVLYIKSSSPSVARVRLTDFKKEQQQINNLLQTWNPPYTLDSLIKISIGVSIILGLIFLMLGLFTGNTLFYFLFGFSLMIPVIVYFYLGYLVSNRTSEIERSLPDALFQAASSKRLNLEKIIRDISKRDYGPLSEEFAMVERQIKAGTNIEDALTDLVERNNSVLLERTVSLLIYGYRSGAAMGRALRETAEDIFSLFSLVRERKAVLSIQKYTILIGGGILVPMILGIVVQVVSGLNMSGIAEYFKSGTDTESLLDTVRWAIPGYLLVYSALSSYLIASQEGDNRKAIVYFVFMALISILLFNLSLTVKVL